MKPFSRASRIFSEPRWRSRSQWRQAELPAGVASWLFDGGSLTRRLRGICRGCLQVRVLGQHLAYPLPSEACALKLDRRVYVWVREVQLLCDERPLVFARTVIALPNLRGPLQRLAHLGTRPLGEVLFADPRVRRSHVEAACVRSAHHLHRLALCNSAWGAVPVWGRRSVFRLNGQALLVCEMFLPDLFVP